MEREGLFAKLGVWADAHALAVASVLAAFGWAMFPGAMQVAASEESTRLWRFGAVAWCLATGGVSLWIACRQNSVTKSNVRLAKENEELRSLVDSFGSDIPSLWAAKLRVLGDELGFNGGDRVSIYRYEDETFLMVGRFAQRPEFEKPGRSVYPASQGVIGQAWRDAEGFAYVDNLPDPIRDPQGYSARSVAQHALPLDVCNGLKMKSRSIYAHVLLADESRSRAAIIVIESESANRFPLERIKSVMSGTQGPEIIHLLKLTKQREPSLHYAREKGF